MRIAIANLKHLYQCQAFWAVYAVLAVFLWPLTGLLDRGSPLVWFYYLMVNLMAGVGFGLLQQEILCLPFTFCLPGHRPIPRRLVFAFGVALNLPLSLYIVFRRDLSSYNVPVIMTAAFSFGLTWYLWVAAFFCTVREKRAYGLAVIPIIPIVFAAKFVDDLVLRLPALFALLGIITCRVIWPYLRGDRLARRHAGRPTSYFSALSKAARRREESTAYASSGLLSRWVPMFFHARIEACRPLSTARCVWGDLYVTFAMLLSWWKWILLMCLATAFFLAYVAAKMRPSGADTFAISLVRTFGATLLVPAICVSLMTTFQMCLQVSSSMLLTRGRRERFGGMISTAVAMTLFLSLLLMLVTVGTLLLQYLAPGVFGSLMHIFGGPITVVFVVIPFVLVPLGLTTRLIVKYLDVTIIYVFVFCVFLLILTVNHWFAWIGAPLLVTTCACCWTALVLATHRICTKRCLVE